MGLPEYKANGTPVSLDGFAAKAVSTIDDFTQLPQLRAVAGRCCALERVVEFLRVGAFENAAFGESRAGKSPC